MQRANLLALSLSITLIAPAATLADGPQTISIRLKASADGALDKLILDGETIRASQDGKKTGLDVLQSRVRQLVAMAAMRNEFEAELECDYDLQYVHVVRVITAITQYKDPQQGGTAVQLIKRIKFKPPRGR